MRHMVRGIMTTPVQPGGEAVVCPPWNLREMWETDGLHPIGADCIYCRRDVALPRSQPSARPVCMYCALDRGARAAFALVHELGLETAKALPAPAAEGINSFLYALADTDRLAAVCVSMINSPLLTEHTSSEQEG